MVVFGPASAEVKFLEKSTNVGRHFTWGFSQGCIRDFPEVDTPWDPDGALFRLNHLHSGRSCTSGLGRKRSFNKLPLVKQERVSTLRYWSSSYESGSESLPMHDAVSATKKRGPAERQAP